MIKFCAPLSKIIIYDMKYKNEYHSIMLSRNNDMNLITVLKFKMYVFMNMLSNNNNDMDMIFKFVQINRMAL